MRPSSAKWLRCFLDQILRSHMCANNNKFASFQNQFWPFKVFYRMPDKGNNSSSVSSYALQGKLFEPASSYKPAMAETCNVWYVVFKKYNLSHIRLVSHARFLACEQALYLEDSRVVTRDQNAKEDASVRKEKENVKRERACSQAKAFSKSRTRKTRMK